jgi:hypothetical protein
MICQKEVLGQSVPMRRREHKFIGKIEKFCASGLFLSALLSYSATAENSIRPLRPADVVMNEEAGRGGLLIMTVRTESGEDWPLVLDTGCAKTGFDPSLAPKLGPSNATETFWNFGVEHQGTLYAPPKLYLGGVLLRNSSTNVGTYDCGGISAFVGRPILGILGIDVLKNYCVQLDFKGRRIRFLDDEHSNKDGWGEAFALNQSRDECFYTDANLAGVVGRGTLIDSGSLHDGWLRPDIYERWTNLSKPPEGSESRCPRGVLGKETYPELDLENLDEKAIASGDLHTGFNRIGIQFLSLHLVTLDFPGRTMYLKRTTETSGYTSAVQFLKSLRENGRLPGWSKDEAILPAQPNLHFHYPNSATYDIYKIGDSSFLYHYVIDRASESGEWKLQRAWRTDSSGKTNEEYSVR